VGALGGAPKFEERGKGVRTVDKEGVSQNSCGR